MARVVAYIPDLLFGSQVQGSLRAAGHDVDLVGDWDRVSSTLGGVDVLVIDLTHEPSRRIGLLGLLPRRDLGGVRTLAFYSHVDVEVRRLAENAGLDLVVPRSRMAREGSVLVTEMCMPS